MNKPKKYHLFEVLVYFVLLLIAFFIQSTPVLFEYNSPAPSMILAVLLVVSMYENYWFSAIFGLVAGVMLDSISANGSGFHAILYMLTGVFCSLILEAFFQNNFASFAVISAPVIIIHQIAELLSNSGFTNGLLKLFTDYYIIVAIYTFASAFILYLAFYFIFKKDERFKKPAGIIKKKK